MEAIYSGSSWGVAQRVMLRFVLLYILLYIIPFPLYFLDELDAWNAIAGYFDSVVIYVARHVLQFSQEVVRIDGGSGDTSYDYAQVATYLLVSGMGSTIWSLIDRQQRNYDELLYMLKVLVRGYLCFYLIGYGISKLPESQFKSPDANHLLQPYGESSPMRLAWVFFGYSPFFTLFTGFFEAIGGVFLLFRRTTLLGACIGASVTSVIVMVNFCFDVPVKLFSMHLFLMCVFVIVIDGKRFLNFFLLNRTVLPEDFSSVFHKKSWQVAQVAFKAFIVCSMPLLLIPIFAFKGEKYSTTRRWSLAMDTVRVLLILIMGLYFWSATYSGRTILAAGIPRPKYTMYKVEQFVRNGAVVPLSKTDDTIWDMVVLSSGGSGQVRSMTGWVRHINIESKSPNDSDTLGKVYGFGSGAMSYRISGEVMMISGVCKWVNPDKPKSMLFRDVKADTIEVTLRRDTSKLQLINRGFHWINEYPFNR